MRGGRTMVVALALVVCLPLLINGPLLSADSLSYLTTARNLLHGNGLVAADGHRITEFMPLLSLLLTGLFALGLSPREAITLVNFVAALIVFEVVRLWALQREFTKRRRSLLLVATAALYPVAYVWQWTWTEPLFLAAVVFALYAAERAAIERRWYAFCVGAAMVACGLRYAGVLLVLGLSLHLAFNKRKFALLAPVALIPTVAWLLVNSGDAGGRPDSQLTLVASVHGVASVIGKWMVGPVPGVGTVVGLIVIVLIGVSAVKNRQSVVAVYGACYLIGISILAAATGISPPNDRLLLPAVPALLLGAASIKHRKMSWLAAAWTAINAGVLIVYQAQRSFA